MKPDDHLRKALRHAPDAAQEAPSELSAQIIAAGYRAAAPAPARPAPRPGWWAAWWGRGPLRLGASGALATVLLASVIGLMWQATTPGPGRGDESGDGGARHAASPAVPPAPAAIQERAATVERQAAHASPNALPSPTDLPARTGDPAAAVVRDSRASAERARQGVPTTATLSALPAPTAEAAARALPVVQPVPAAPLLRAAPAPPPASATADVDAGAAGAAPSAAPVRPAPPAPVGVHAGAGAADNASTAAATPPPRPMAARMAAAAPTPLRAPALALAQEALPWAAAVADPASSHRWRLKGVATPIDRDWLATLAELTHGQWAAAPASAAGAEALVVDWLQGDTFVGRLWLDPVRATWCSPQARCQTAPLPQEAAATLVDRLNKMLDRTQKEKLPR